ncbi:MAG: ADP-ribose pyrophosphatase [Ramlibacter sp.]|jgi:ADP-ribose pyrophosphatase|nr:ADP-ribose pyrophosphatase [Ramlibacter sp.]MDB5912820.1 ADP-ribose pyrophosphatase [Ramlibacter sp.]
MPLLPTLTAPTILSEEIIYDSPWLRVRRVDTQFASGLVRPFSLKEEPDVAVCLPVTPDGRFVLVEEYRHGPRRALFELPAGVVDPGEDPLAAAAREALEETGYQGAIRHLGSTWISAYSGARKHIFLMEDAQRVGEPQPEPHELMRVVVATREEFEEVVRSGELSDLDAALLCLRRLQDGAQERTRTSTELPAST